LAKDEKAAEFLRGETLRYPLYDGSKLFRLPEARNPIASDNDSKEAA